jgi:hypothetical protein
VLYYNAHYKDTPAMSSTEVRVGLREARVPGASSVNVSDVLARSGHFVDAAETNQRGHRLWRLTDSGARHLRQELGLPDEQPEIEHDVAALSRLAHRVSNDVVRSYFEEAILCLRVNALRAAIVFVWSGAIRTLQEEALSRGASAVSQAVQKHDARAKQVQKIEDFSAIRDVTTLLACRELGLIDKGEWQTLDEALGLRNRCGHPTQYRPGVKKASSYIEDVVGIVYL